MLPYDRYRTGDQTLVRQMNLSVILHRLLERAPLSRAALAEMTGLNKATVSSLVRELLDHRFVRETGIDSAGTGRPAVLLELNPEAGCILSAEIGVDFVSVVRTDFSAAITWRHHERITPNSGQSVILQRTSQLLQEAVAASREACSTLFGISVGVPGLIDQESGQLLFAPNLGWRDVPVGVLLRDTFDVPVFVDNEANMAALGEHFFGAAQGFQEVLYISAGVGLGGGIVRGGRLFKGATGYAGEFGHITLDPNGELCACGNHGCWETMVSQAALFRHVRRALAGGTPSTLGELGGGDLEQLTVPMVVEAARAGDTVALEALARIGQALGVGIASLVNALNPELVVFGGILSLGGEWLLPAMQEELQRRALPWPSGTTKVVLADNGVDACVLGGVATVVQAVLSQPVGVMRQAV